VYVLGIGMQEILLLLIVAMFLFGAQRLPEIGRSLGKGIKEFKKAGRKMGKLPQNDQIVTL